MSDKVLGIGLGALGAIAQMGLNQSSMGAQLGNQMKLNEQAARLARENWDYTNFGNQVKHMKNAGLNVGLMYGGGGQGGQSGTGSGGSAGMAQAPDIMEIMQNQANLELIKAQTKKANAEAEKIGGVDTQKVSTEIASLTQGINNQKAEEQLTNVMKEVNTIGMEEAKERIRALGYENKINSSVINEKIKIVQNEAVKGVLENALLKTQNENLKQMTAESKARINKMSEDIAQGWGHLGVAEKQARLKEFESNLKAEYPTIGESAGRLVNELQLGLETLFGVREERYHRNTKEQK